MSGTEDVEVSDEANHGGDSASIETAPDESLYSRNPNGFPPAHAFTLLTDCESNLLALSTVLADGVESDELQERAREVRLEVISLLVDLADERGLCRQEAKALYHRRPEDVWDADVDGRADR